jgi:hypothetical protein
MRKENNEIRRMERKSFEELDSNGRSPIISKG